MSQVITNTPSTTRRPRTRSKRGPYLASAAVPESGPTTHAKHDGKPTARARRKTGRKRVKQAVDYFENSMHYSVAVILGAIATVMMAETIRALVTASTTFAVAASSALEGVLFVLILVEITRTVVFPPDRAVAIRRLLVIAIVSAIREVLVISANSMVHSPASPNQVINIPLEMGISTAVVVGLAAAFLLLRRATEKRG